MNRCVAFVTVALIILAMVSVACQPGTPRNAGAPKTLDLSASVVMKDVLTEVDAAYARINPDVTFVPNFASAGVIQHQIENGAPCDVFVCAAESFMDNLQTQGLIINSTRKDLLTNKIVLIVPLSAQSGLKGFEDLSSDTIQRIAIGDPKSVSAGMYAKQAFDLFGITEAIQSKFVLAADVRQVLTYVETGNVDAGVVFATDAMTSSKVKIIATAPGEINARITYPVAVMTATRNLALATDYVSFLGSATARAVFEKYGFAVLPR